MKEILPGLFHWRVIWPDIWSLESYFLRTGTGSVIIDPIESGRLDVVDQATDVEAVIVTSGWHERSARLFGKRTCAPVFVPERDLCMFEDLDVFETYDDGDDLPGGIRAIGAPGLTRGEHALLSSMHSGVLFTADCVGTTAKWAPGGMKIGGHPNGHPNPSATLSHLLEPEFSHLCPGHGNPLIGNGKAELAKLLESGVSTSSGRPAVTYFPLDPAQQPSTP